MKRACKYLMIFMTVLIATSLVPVEKTLALDGPIRNTKEVIQYIEGESVHTATCVQLPGGTMKWENYNQEETNWPSSIAYPKDADGYYGTLYRATQNLVRIDQLGGPCSTASDAGNDLYDKHVYRAQYKGTVQTDPLPVKPPVIIYGSCDSPSAVPPRYEHEMDLEVTRIDARTVDIKSDTETDVYVKREDFSTSRTNVKNEFSSYISQVNSLENDCQSKISSWQSQKSSMESNYALCTSQERPNCYVFTDAIGVYNSQISAGQAMLGVYSDRIGQANTELNYISSNEAAYQSVQPKVLFWTDNEEVGSIDVSLKEGDVLRRTFTWEVTLEDEDIMAQINEKGPYQEFRYSNLASRTRASLGYHTSLGHVLYPNTSSNNWKDTIQYVSTYETASCPNPLNEDDYFQEQSIQAIVRTINDNGTRRNMFEELTTSFTRLPVEEIRAGSGFEYEITTTYKNNDTEPDSSTATGTKKVESYFPSLVDYQPYSIGGARPSFDIYGNALPNGGKDEGYRVGMETSVAASPKNDTRAWILPLVAIENFSGNVFTVNNNDHLYHPERNIHDILVLEDDQGNPLNKWFTNFTDPNGTYDYRVRTYDAGVNHLNTCHNGKTELKGTTIGDPNGDDDYVKRAITPANPFPSGVGWNWTDKVNILTNLSDWYFNWYENPDNLPLNDYRATFYLTQETMKKINEYTKEHPEVIPGESVLDYVDVPAYKEGE